jgi:hypothetical protein
MQNCRMQKTGHSEFCILHSFILHFLTGLTGLEPATSGVTDRHSNQLSYSPRFSSLRPA